MSLRAENERRSYDKGNVYARSHALHLRFLHVFTCPNALYGEAYWQKQLGRCATDRADRLIERSALRYWMRQVVLVWEKN